MARLKLRKTPAAAPKVAPEVTPPAADWIVKEEARVLADLASARELRDQLLIEQTPGALAQVIAVEDEIELHERVLRRLDAARALRDAASTKEARAARHEQTKRELQEALDDTRKLGEMGKQVLITLVELGAQLQAMQEIRDTVRVRFSTALRSAEGLKEHVVESHHRVLDMALREVTLPASFQDRAWRSGAGRVGVHLDPDVLRVKPPSGFWQEGDLDETIASAVNKLKAIGNAALLKEAA